MIGIAVKTGSGAIYRDDDLVTMKDFTVKPADSLKLRDEILQLSGAKVSSALIVAIYRWGRGA